MYSRFYYSFDEEIGRQALLQHIIRRAIQAGISKSTLIFNTDEALLFLLENQYTSNNIDEEKFQYSIKDLILNYRLLTDTYKVVEIVIENEEEIRIVSNPLFAEWVESHLTNKFFKPFVFIKRRRFEEKGQLFSPPWGSIIIFKLNSTSLKHNQLPSWVREQIFEKLTGENLTRELNRVIKMQLKTWIDEKPWIDLNLNK